MKIKNINAELAYAKNGISTCTKELETIQKRRLTLPRLTKNEADFYSEKLDNRKTKAKRLKAIYKHLIAQFKK